MKINEKYENVDGYRFVDKKHRKPKRRVTMEDLFDDEEIIDEEEMNEDLSSDMTKPGSTNMAFVSKSKNKDMTKTIKDLKSKKIMPIVVDNVNEGGCGCGGGKTINESIDVKKTNTGYLVLSKRLNNGDLFKRKYMDYTEKDAKAKFKKEFDIENKKTLKEGGCGCGGGKTLEEADIMSRRSLPGIGGAAPGVGMNSRVSKENGKINKSSYEESMKKISKYNDIKLKSQLVDNGGTPKTAIGDDNTKKYGVANDEDYIEELAKSGLNNLDLDYDREPSEKFKERVKKDLDGDESIAMKIANKRKELQGNQSVYSTMYKDPKKMKDIVNNHKAFGKNRKVENESINSIVSRIVNEAIAMTESKKGKPDFLDLDKDGNKKESMKKAAKESKKGFKSYNFKKKDVNESEGWVTILDNSDIKEINSKPQPKVERPSSDMGIATGFSGINLGTLRVENAQNLDKIVIPEDYRKEGNVFNITDDNRTVKVRFEEGELIVLADKNKKMINEETSKIMKLMNYNYNTKPTAKSVMKEDVNATLKKMLNEVKGLSKGE